MCVNVCVCVSVCLCVCVCLNVCVCVCLLAYPMHVWHVVLFPFCAYFAASVDAGLGSLTAKAAKYTTPIRGNATVQQAIISAQPQP